MEKTKEIGEKEVLASYARPIQDDPRMAAALRELSEARKAEAAIGAAVQRIGELRESGSRTELLTALASAPSEHDDDEAKLRLLAAQTNVENVREAIRTEREARFREYAKPQVRQLLNDLDAVLKRSAGFHRVAELRHDALSGVLPFVDDVAFLRLGALIEAYRASVQQELGIDV